MKLTDKKSWSIFVFSLLYPGILGSIIYDISNLIRGSHFDWFNITQLFIVLIFISDYMHIYFDLNDELKFSNYRLIIDCLIPLCFGAIYWSMTREDFTSLFFILSIVMGLIFIYPCPNAWNKKLYFGGKSVSFIISLIACYIFAIGDYFSNNMAVYFVGAIFFGYLIHVFIITQYSKKKNV